MAGSRVGSPPGGLRELGHSSFSSFDGTHRLSGQVGVVGGAVGDGGAAMLGHPGEPVADRGADDGVAAEPGLRAVLDG